MTERPPVAVAPRAESSALPPTAENDAPITGTGPGPGSTADRAGPAPTTTDTAANPASDEEELSPLRSALSVLATIGPPITVITALMHYFGWARTDVQASAMGLDVSLFGYSPQDYIIRSVSTLFVPLLVTGAVALGWLALHRRIVDLMPRVRTPRGLRAAGWNVLAVGLLASGVSVAIAVVDDQRGPVFLPLVFAVAVAVAAYGAWLVRATSGQHQVIPPWQRALRGLLTGAVITMALFWQMSNYAGVVGRGYVQQLANSANDLPRVWAYSSVPLGIEAPGVTEELLTEEAVAEGDTPRYRTSGLRLLTSSGGRLFLLHDGWTPASGTVVLLPDDGEIRWQFSN